MSLATLDDLELNLTAYSGFNYPSNGQIVALLGDGTSTGGNAVLQQSALTYRQTAIAWLAESIEDVEAVRDLYETKEEVTFVDEWDVDRGVRVWEFSSSAIGGDRWDCTATLVETTEPGS